MRDVYCDIRFIEDLISKPPLIAPYDEKSINQQQCWLDFCSFLLKSHLHLNVSDEDINNRELKKDEMTSTNMFFKQLVKRQSSGLCEIDGDFDSNSLADSVPDLNGVYLVCKNRVKCELLSKKYGVLIIPMSDYTSYSYLFKDGGTTISINDKNYKSWSLLAQNGSKICNSMMIIDNYLLTDKDKMTENLTSILQSLLPEHIENPFQLCFFTLLYDQGTDSHRNLQERYDDILNIIKEIRGYSYKVSLTIFKCKKYRFSDPKRFHGRVILTNNVLICSDGGFDLFKNGEATKLTIVNIVYPHFTDRIRWASSALEDYLKEAKAESDVSDAYNKNQNDIAGRYLGDKDLSILKLITT